MRRLLVLALLSLSLNAFAGNTLRIGQQVLSVGDTAVHAIDLLGTPAYKEPVQNKFGAYLGERWQFRRDKGHVVVVTPAADHLATLRRRLFETLVEHQPDKFIAGFEPRFELVRRDELRTELSLDNSALRQLLAMTPYVWKAKPERRAALEASPRLDTAAAFSLLLFRKLG